MKQAMHLMKTKAFTSPELVAASISNLDKYDYLNAFVSHRDRAVMMQEAETSQARIEKSKFVLLRLYLRLATI